MPPKNYDSEIGGPDFRTDARNQGPRLVVAGLSGDSGQDARDASASSLALRERGTDVRAFKKGPDYIDAAWLSWASGHPARNLDTWMLGFAAARDSFARHAKTRAST